MPESQIYSVSRITQVVKAQLEMQFPNILVTGEISNFRPAASGHYYFAIKDAFSSLSVVMFRSRQKNASFTPADGDKVIVRGSISVYAARGTYQLIAESIRYAGEGDILALLEERKRYYASLGYFDESCKKPIPPFPSTIGVVTSDTGAAIRDILHVIERRSRGLRIIIYPTLVQGEKAGEMIARRIAQAAGTQELDVLIVTRGGGSMEDLLPFSEPQVIEAIYHCQIPVISAVGHEIDHTLSDYVADLRAPTPSAAGELVSTSYATILDRLNAAMRELALTMNHRIRQARSITNINSPQMMHERIAWRLREYTQRSDDLFSTSEHLIRLNVKRTEQELKARLQELHALSPLSILQRGYAIITKEEGNGRLVDAHQVHRGEHLEVRLHRGSLKVTTDTIIEEGREI
ncbi:MAG: exodeoxyribonuclease VII large subunit [Sphaerochaetaceae bacterium]|nr:exodeoxyribonuclease VII large subunit [Sphaerochaetaceae bacterium]